MGDIGEDPLEGVGSSSGPDKHDPSTDRDVRGAEGVETVQHRAHDSLHRGSSQVLGSDIGAQPGEGPPDIVLVSDPLRFEGGEEGHARRSGSGAERQLVEPVPVGAEEMRHCVNDVHAVPKLDLGQEPSGGVGEARR